MKHVSVLALSAMTTIGAIPFGAIAAGPVSHLNANGIAVHNITVIQHSAILNAFDNFNGQYTTSFTDSTGQDTIAEYVTPQEQTTQNRDLSKDYGKMSTYGEYGDDGTVFLQKRGRSGGDSDIDTPLWIDWHHTKNQAKFDKFKSVDSNQDIISLGFADNPNVLSNGYSQFGGFGGIVLSNEETDNTELQENGGYIGLYQGYHINNLNINLAADFGTLYTDVKSPIADQNLTNLWLGVAAKISYDIALDQESVLQPGLYAGYTWVHSNGYETTSGHMASINDFNAFELSPALRIISHIGNGWYGTISGRYIFNFASGGDVQINAPGVTELDLMDYAEYGLSFEKNWEQFNFAISLNRCDGGRTGWNGGIHMQYRF